mmetsp:Transcript_42004/g.63451  ORF Transcript_42004/g.63451 Transcript_42004/m.63451 type:complete len:90 (+) Transcript_42004:232-501(+)
MGKDSAGKSRSSKEFSKRVLQKPQRDFSIESRTARAQSAPLSLNFLEANESPKEQWKCWNRRLAMRLPDVRQLPSSMFSDACLHGELHA